MERQRMTAERYKKCAMLADISEDCATCKRTGFYRKSIQKKEQKFDFASIQIRWFMVR